MARRRGQGKAQEALEGLLAGLDSATKVRESLAFAYWPEAVGESAAAASEPESIRDGVLIVRTKSSVWSQEISFHKAHVIEKLNQRIGRPVIKEIVLRAQGLEETAPAGETPDTPTEEALNAVRLPLSEQAALRQELDALVSIPDDRLRRSVARRMIRDRRLRRWRLEHGWHPCARCTALHRDAGDLCPICRLCR